MFLVLILCLSSALNAVKAHGGGHGWTGTAIGIVGDFGHIRVRREDFADS
jgi:hypothetical protein